MDRTLTWKTHEHEHRERGADWFWALGILVVSSALVAVLFQNFLFALLLLVGGFTVGLLAAQPPRLITFSLTPRGVLIDDALYPYQMLNAFDISEQNRETPLLIVDARRFLTPHLIIPLEGVAPDDVHAYLAEYLPEEELDEPIAQRIAERFGF